jgi:rubrerythrin
MDLNNFELEYLLLTAVKNELDSRDIYSKMAKRTKNGLLEDKLEFLAKEEEKHRKFIAEIYKNHYPGKELNLPEKTAVPLPEISYSEETEMSELLSQAMDAESVASKFYKNLATRFEEGTKIFNTLMYFSDMETGHFKILEMEKESMQRYEEDDVYWPMVHAGP